MSTAKDASVTGDLFFITLEAMEISPGRQEQPQLFDQPELRDSFIRALIFCIEKEIITLYGFVILSNQIHLIISAKEKDAPERIKMLKKCTSDELFSDITKTIGAMDNVKSKDRKELRKVFTSFLNMDHARFWKKDKKMIRLKSKKGLGDFKPVSSDALLRHLTDDNLDYMHLGASTFTRIMLHCMSD